MPPQNAEATVMVSTSTTPAMSAVRCSLSTAANAARALGPSALIRAASST
jgi:hypothetical protein